MAYRILRGQLETLAGVFRAMAGKYQGLFHELLSPDETVLAGGWEEFIARHGKPHGHGWESWDPWRFGHMNDYGRFSGSNEGLEDFRRQAENGLAVLEELRRLPGRGESVPAGFRVNSPFYTGYRAWLNHVYETALFSPTGLVRVTEHTWGNAAEPDEAYEQLARRLANQMQAHALRERIASARKVLSDSQITDKVAALDAIPTTDETLAARHRSILADIRGACSDPRTVQRFLEEFRRTCPPDDSVVEQIQHARPEDRAQLAAVAKLVLFLEDWAAEVAPSAVAVWCTELTSDVFTASAEAIRIWLSWPKPAPLSGSAYSGSGINNLPPPEVSPSIVRAATASACSQVAISMGSQNLCLIPDVSSDDGRRTLTVPEQYQGILRLFIPKVWEGSPHEVLSWNRLNEEVGKDPDPVASGLLRKTLFYLNRYVESEFGLPPDKQSWFVTQKGQGVSLNKSVRWTLGEKITRQFAKVGKEIAVDPQQLQARTPDRGQRLPSRPVYRGPKPDRD